MLFNPRQFKNISESDKSENLGTVTDFICDDVLGEGNP